MHANDLVKQILGLKGVVMSEVSLSQVEIVVKLKLTRTKLVRTKFVLPNCNYSTYLPLRHQNSQLPLETYGHGSSSDMDLLST